MRFNIWAFSILEFLSRTVVLAQACSFGNEFKWYDLEFL